MNSVETSSAHRFLSAVEVRTGGGVRWIAAAFSGPGGLIEAVYRLRDGQVVFETVYFSAVGYWDSDHPFWGELIVLDVGAASPVDGLAVPVGALRELGAPVRRERDERPFMVGRKGKGSRRAIFPLRRGSRGSRGTE